jgi:hypothetical protein
MVTDGRTVIPPNFSKRYNMYGDYTKQQLSIEELWILKLSPRNET